MNHCYVTCIKKKPGMSSCTDGYHKFPLSTCTVDSDPNQAQGCMGNTEEETSVNLTWSTYLEKVNCVVKPSKKKKKH